MIHSLLYFFHLILSSYLWIFNRDEIDLEYLTFMWWISELVMNTNFLIFGYYITVVKGIL